MSSDKMYVFNGIEMKYIDAKTTMKYSLKLLTET
jgi:hypothetical protein